MAKCIVVGGGFAGLSSAVFLTDKGNQVKLIEASPKLGGRAYSLEYNNDVIDNGQHIMMGCYMFTLEFLELINALDKIEIQPNLKINFVERGCKFYQLNTEGSIYPFNILLALKNYNALTKSEKHSIVKLFLRIALCNPKHYEEITTKEFLEKNNQSQNSINALWEIIHVGTMNCKMEESSAEIFIRVLKEIFFTVDASTKIILPKVGLTQMYCEPSQKFIEERNATINFSEKLLEIEFDEEQQKAVSITTSEQTYDDFDFIILAIPPHQIENILVKSNIDLSLPNYEYSSILNIHLWLEENPFTEKFYGLIDSKIHWLFNHGQHISLTTSAADEFMGQTNDQIFMTVMHEISKYFINLESNKVLRHLIIKEKRATFKPTIQNSITRKELPNNLGNLFFTGDWTNTGFPATIESAVKSAWLVSNKITSNV